MGTRTLRCSRAETPLGKLQRASKSYGLYNSQAKALRRPMLCCFSNSLLFCPSLAACKHCTRKRATIQTPAVTWFFVLKKKQTLKKTSTQSVKIPHNQMANCSAQLLPAGGKQSSNIYQTEYANRELSCTFAHHFLKTDILFLHIIKVVIYLLLEHTEMRFAGLRTLALVSVAGDKKFFPLTKALQLK